MTTPMMQQYQEAKERHPGMLVVFRMGDFFELFGEEAELAHRILGLTLTHRDTIPMAGFPHERLETYLRDLLRAGYRVAVCDQVEEAAQAKGLIRREVTRVVTPGTVTDDNLIDPREANHLASLSPVGERIGLAWIELSTGVMQVADVPQSRLRDELVRLTPSECLIPESTQDRLQALLGSVVQDANWTVRPDWNFDPGTALTTLCEHLGVATLAGFGLADDQAGVRAAGGLLLYLKETLKAQLGHLRRLKPYQTDQLLFLDEVTRRSLELTRTLREGHRDGSLLAMLDRCVTAMGSRMLQDWLTNPFRDRQPIEERLDAIEELLPEHGLRQELRELLGQVLDLQRLATRASTGRATPRDLGAIARTLRLLPRLKARLTARRSGLLNQLESRLDLCPDLRQEIDSALLDELPLSSREGGIIRRGYHAELDEIHQIAHGGKEWIARYQADEIRRTGIPSLKVGFNQVFGYYIEVTHVHTEKIPSDYIRKQTLKNAERYITPELKEYEEKVLTAEERIHQLEYELFLKLRELVANQTVRLLQTAEILATLDVLGALTEVAAARQYCRPQLCEEPFLEILDGRHPVLDQTLPPGTFVPNDVVLGPKAGRFWLISGPNMAGKSVFIRQVALLTLMAQMGSFIPARMARIGLTDRIFTRVGASDELSRGHSTFMVEMTEAANILNNATRHSLVILDEIGRGTSTYDGISLAWAISEYLHDVTECRALFATHYHELAHLTESLPGLRNYNVQVREGENQIIFLHKIAAGSADKSYGIHVAQIAGVPAEVIDRARDVLRELESRQVATRRSRRRRSRSEQPSLFAEFDET